MASINRFYKSSAPRYTSQFIEDRYPEQLIMQAGAMKYGQQQQFAKDVGEIEGLNAITPYGYRTTDLAPLVKKKYSDRINEFKNKFATAYDTPQAVQELSKIRTEFQGDRDRQLMMMDATQGNEERNAQMRSTDTYHLDYDPNVSQQTGRVNQFRPGDPYAPYNPLVQYTDLNQYANEQFSNVKPDVIQVPIMNEAGESVGTRRREYIDPNKMETAIQELANSAVRGDSKEGAYMSTRFRDEKGNPRTPTYEEAYNYYRPKADKYMLERNVMDIDKTTGTSNGGGKDGKGFATYPVGSTVKPSNFMKSSKKEVNQKRLYDHFTNNNIPLETDSGFKNILAQVARTDKNIMNGTEREKAKAIKNFMDNANKSELNLSVKRFTDPKQNDTAAAVVFGEAVSNGVVRADMTGTILKGSLPYDMDTGERLDLDEIDTLLKKEGEAQFVGPLDDRSAVLAPYPGATVIEVGGKRILSKGSEEYVQKDKTRWNFNGFERAVDTGIGDTFQFQIHRGGGYSINDVSDIGKEGDQTTLNEPGPLYIVPVKDYTDTDNYGNPSIKVKVYAYNPTLEGAGWKGTSNVGEVRDATPEEIGGDRVGDRTYQSGRQISNDGILDNTNRLRIKEYNLADFRDKVNAKGEPADPMASVISQILEDRDELINTQRSIIDNIQ